MQSLKHSEEPKVVKQGKAEVPGYHDSKLPEAFPDSQGKTWENPLERGFW